MSIWKLGLLSPTMKKNQKMTEQYGYACSTHCCKWHGCKYGYSKNNIYVKTLCAVKDGGVDQEYPCEYCSEEWDRYQDFLKIDPEWIAYITKWKSEGGYL